MIREQGTLSTRERQAIDDLKAQVMGKFSRELIPGSTQRENLTVLDRDYILNKVALRHSRGEDPGYFNGDATIEGMFANLGENIVARVNATNAKKIRGSVDAAGIYVSKGRQPVSNGQVPVSVQLSSSAGSDRLAS